VPIGLAGEHQRDNAGIADLLGERLGASREARARGIATVRWPGRLETLEADGGPVLLDAAHNPDGIRTLTRHLDAIGARPERTALVFGTLADKDWRAMASAIAPHAAHRFYVRPQGRTPTSPSDLDALAPGEEVATVGGALARARAAVGADGLVVVAGSIFLVGEARALLLGLPRDPAVAL